MDILSHKAKGIKINVIVIIGNNKQWAVTFFFSKTCMVIKQQ